MFTLSPFAGADTVGARGMCAELSLPPHSGFVQGPEIWMKTVGDMVSAPFNRLRGKGTGETNHSAQCRCFYVHARDIVLVTSSDCLFRGLGRLGRLGRSHRIPFLRHA